MTVRVRRAQRRARTSMLAQRAMDVELNAKKVLLQVAWLL